MTGQSCAAVCVVLCILAATAHSSRLPQVPSLYDADYGFPEEQAFDDYRGQMNDIELQNTPEMMYFPSDTARGFPEEQALDDYYDQVNGNELTYTPEMTYVSSDTAEAFEMDPSKIKVDVIGTEICVSYGILKFCFQKSDASEQICGHRIGKLLTLGCRVKDEEGYGGLCYKKCSILTDENYPKRTATNICAKKECGPNQEKDIGRCYPKCKEYYKGVGPVCWGSCSHFCGSKYKNVGLTCYRFWPPKFCKKPKYGRGVGTLPFKIKGFGCNGFGVNGDGGCAKINILKFVKLPFGITCP